VLPYLLGRDRGARTNCAGLRMYLVQKCLNNHVAEALKDRASFPPKCCTKQDIDIETIIRYLGAGLRLRWHIIGEEFSDPNSTYCANAECGLYLSTQSSKQKASTTSWREVSGWDLCGLRIAATIPQYSNTRMPSGSKRSEHAAHEGSILEAMSTLWCD
jgi:hypothetical protein